MKKNNLNNTCCLVVRYFGGIKLGVGGLSRAYSNATLEALKKAIIVEDYIYPKYELILDYEVANKLDNLLINNTYLLNKDYDVNVKITFVLKNENILDKIKEITKGKSPTLIGEEVIQKVIK